jgi:hypothetical protein
VIAPLAAGSRLEIASTQIGGPWIVRSAVA